MPINADQFSMIHMTFHRPSKCILHGGVEFEVITKTKAKALKNSNEKDVWTEFLGTIIKNNIALQILLLLLNHHTETFAKWA